MSTSAIIVIVFIILFGLLSLRAPVALALALSGVTGILLLEGPARMLQTMGSVPYQSVASYSLMVIPMFILMGMVVMKTSIATDLFSVASRLLHWLPGGLGVATIAVCAGFAAVTGSSVATVATLGRMCVTEMRNRGYSESFAAGIIGAGGTLGVLIPPSIPLVIYGVLTGVSIGALMIAAIIPGVITAMAYAGLIVLRAKRKPHLIMNELTHSKVVAPVEREGGADRVRTGDSFRDEQKFSKGGSAAGLRPQMLPNDRRRGGLAIAQIGILFTIVIGGIYSGVFTVTESGAIGALAALVMLVLNALKDGRGLMGRIFSALHESATLTTVIFAVLIGSGFLTYFLTISRIPTDLTRWISGMDVEPVIVLILFLLLLIPLGMFLDSISILVITVPLVYEPLTALGIDGVVLGILMVKMVEIGLITPPVGLNAFVLSGTVPKLPVETVFKGLIPFVVLEVILVALYLVFPDLILFLPEMMR